jgi:hypothetical protein
MSTIDESAEDATAPSDINTIPGAAVEGKREFSRQLDLAIGDVENLPTFQSQLLRCLLGTKKHAAN